MCIKTDHVGVCNSGDYLYSNHWSKTAISRVFSPAILKLIGILLHLHPNIPLTFPKQRVTLKNMIGAIMFYVCGIVLYSIIVST